MTIKAAWFLSEKKEVRYLTYTYFLALLRKVLVESFPESPPTTPFNLLLKKQVFFRSENVNKNVNVLGKT